MAITNRDDDYLICSQYKKHIDDISQQYEDFITFQHHDNFYFAWVNDGEIVMRSEAYPSMEKVDRGIKAVLKNREITSRFDVIEAHGAWFSVLYGGGSNEAHTGGFDGHNEIGRSCPQKSKEALLALFMFRGPEYAHAVVPGLAKGKGAGLAAAAVGTGIAATTIAATPVKETTSSATPNAKAAPVVKAASNAGSGFNWMWLLPLLLIPLIFFMWKGCNGSTAAGAEVSDNSQVEMNTENAEDAVVPQDAGMVTNATNGVASGATVDNNAGTMMEENAENTDDVVFSQDAGMVTNATSGVSSGATVDNNAGAMMEEKEIVENTEASAAKVVSCDLNWILFDFDRYDIRSDARQELSEMAKILKEDPKFIGVLKAHTDSRGSTEYNDRLSGNRAKAAKDVLVSMGISANRIKTTASSEASPFAQNTEDDSGRKFNRRVELYVQDANGKDVCTSIPPAVPNALKR